MNELDRNLLIQEIERRTGEAASKDLALVLSYIRPLIATVSAGLKSGAISADDAIKLVPLGDEDDPKALQEAERDRKTIRSWAQST